MPNININKLLYKNTKTLTDASKKSKLQTAICLNLAVSSDFIKWCHDSSTCRVLYDTSIPDGLYGLLVSLGLSVHRNWIAFGCDSMRDRRRRWKSNNGIRNINIAASSTGERPRRVGRSKKERKKSMKNYDYYLFIRSKLMPFSTFSQQFLLNKHYFSSPAGKCVPNQKKKKQNDRLFAFVCSAYQLLLTQLYES